MRIADLQAQEGEIAQRIEEAGTASRVGDNFFAPDSQGEVAAVIAGGEEEVDMRLGLAGFPVEDADGNWLGVDDGEDFVGVGAGGKQQAGQADYA